MTSRKPSFSFNRIFAMTMMFVVIVGISLDPDASRRMFTANAQSATATLAGTVLDEMEAVVPAVNITMLNRNTALQRQASTNDDGYYVIPLLPPGRYNVTIKRAGFTTIEIRDVVLNVNDQLALKVRLRVGQIGESVDIVEDVVGLQQSTAVATVVNRQFVENLPLNGRSFQSLFELTPGTVLTRTSFNEQGQFSVNGGRANANYFMVDGVSANFGVSAGAAPGQAATGALPALTTLGGSNNLVSVDALEEFRIQTSAYAPEFGRTSGAQVSIITRAGTNEFRGTAFNYFRSDRLDANDFFANRRGLGRGSLRQNDFGGVLGGPLMRDRAFFFFSYEGLRLGQPQIALTEVPSLGARRNAPAPIQSFLNAFPQPNGIDFGNGFAEFAASYSDPSRLNATSLRVDATVSERLTFSGRYNHAPSKTVQRGSVIVPGFSARNLVYPTVVQSLNTQTLATLNTQTLTGGLNFSVSPRIINDLRANWSEARGTTSFALDDFGGAVSPPPSLLFPPSASSQDAGFQFLLRSGTSSLAVGKNADNRQRQINLIDNLSVVSGSHQLKFGADYRRLMPVYGPPKYNQSVVYDGITGDVGSLSGMVSQVLIFAGTDPRVSVFTNLSAYAQDTWRAHPRLTLTYGLRWELNPPPMEAHGNDPVTVRNLDDPAALTLAPRGTPLWRTTYNNFAPRFGAAYQLSPLRGRETALRSGIGLFYDLGNGQAAQGFGSVFPYTAVKRLFNVPYPLDPAQAAPPPLSFAPPYGTVVAFDPNLKLPRTFQWNIALEQSLGSDHIVSASYVAALGRRLLREDALVNPNPNFTVVRVTRSEAESDYHALQVQFARRLSRGLQALASYTWSHSIDNASSDSLSRLRGAYIGSGSPGARIVQSIDRGSSDFDVRHSFAGAITYNLPTPSIGAIGHSLLRNWTVDAIFRARTATPVNVVTRTDVLGDGLILELQRPDLIPGVPVYINDSSAPGGRRLNRGAFREPIEDRQGTLGYNALRGFSISQLDLGLHRQFGLTERLNLQFRIEAFNLFNHPNFGNPVSNLSSRFFGESTEMFGRSLGRGGINGGLSPLYQVGGPRSIQAALKLHF